MARLARVVIPGSPHHVTQRGNRRAPTFFEEGDYILYLKWLSEAASNARTEIWVYCLMPNHVHVILTPEDEQGLRRTFADLHRRYTRFINARHGWTGHLWQGRFGSVAMDDAYLAHAVRYVAMNPVRAGLVERAEDWRWSRRTGLFRQGRFAGSLTRHPDWACKAGCSKRISRGNHTGAFDHEHNRPFPRMREVHNTPWHRERLSGRQRNHPIFELDVEMAFHHQEKLVGVVVLVPVEITLHYAKPHPGIVDRT